MGRKGRNKGGGGEKGDSATITEAIRIRVGRVLAEFRETSAAEYTFEPGLTKCERAAIHELCRKKGLISRSSGKGENRCLTVYKVKRKKGNNKVEDELKTCLRFSQETENTLRDLFTQFPPDDTNLTEKTFEGTSRKNIFSRKKDTSFFRPEMSKADITKKLEILAAKREDPLQLKKVTEDRAKLPISSFQDVIMSALDSHQVVLISGETGCGKTTQVPQYILDHMWGKGKGCKIVCTQPRRMSAISVAERIAYERGENVGDTVGYKIRLESQGGRNSSVMFCTNGVLLRVFVGRGLDSIQTGTTVRTSTNNNLGITHIILDEIHERDRFSDFMLAIIRDSLASYPHLRLILMSATIDSERFSQYFGGCPIIRVPGFTHPVKSFYLEDVLSILRSAEKNHLGDANESEVGTQLNDDYKASLDESIDLAIASDEIEPLLELVFAETTPKIFNYQHSSNGVSPLMIFAGSGRVGEVCMLLSLGADCSLRANDGSTALEWAQREGHDQIQEIIEEHLKTDASNFTNDQELLDKYLTSVNPENIDTVLIERLLHKICSDSEEGAILVFLPGWDDIIRTKEKLLASPFFKDSSKIILHSLHSMVPLAEQKKVFKRPPSGVRKIILSTNIAETAVTIDDIVYVIDCGRMKEKNYDPYNNVSTLFSSWISKANAKQRQGRAGRCQPGICYHLYSKARASSLPDHQVPEIKRMPIEELCLQVKLLSSNCKITDFLQKTLDPPIHETIRNAIVVLQDIGALTKDENLTEIGERLGALPVHPTTGKMLFFAIMMNCLDPALTLACASDYRDPFFIPMAPDEKKKAAAAKIELASLYGGYSDHLTIIAAFDCWSRARGKGQESQFCSKYFISSGVMNMLFGMRKQLRNELIKSGFIPKDISDCSLNAQNPGILRAVILAGTYPLVGSMLSRSSNNKRAVVETASGAKVILHSHSSNFKLSFNKSVGGLLLSYDEITRCEGRMHIRSCSVVGPYSLLLLAQEMVVAPSKDNGTGSDEDDDISASDDEMEMNPSTSPPRGEEIMSSPENTVCVVVDRWIKFEATAFDVAQIYCLRERLSAAILFKVKYPREVLPPVLGASVYAIACILSYDGMFGVSPPLEPAYSLTSNLNATGKESSSAEKNSSGKSFNRSSNGFLISLMRDKFPRPNPRNSRVRAPNLSNSGKVKSPHVSVSANTSSSVSRSRSFKRHRGDE